MRSATSFDALAVGVDRALVEIGGELGEFGLLVGEHALGFAQRADLDRVLGLGRLQLILERLLARFEREDRRGLLAELDLEAVDGVGLLAELGELARGLGLHLLDRKLEPARRHGEFGAQLVLVGLDLRHRQRRRRLQPPHGQPHRAVVDERNQHEPEQARDQKTDAKEHDRLDHGRGPPTRNDADASNHATPGRALPDLPTLNLNRRAGCRRIRAGSRSRCGVNFR